MAQTVSTSCSTGSQRNGLSGRCVAGCDQANQQKAGLQGSLQMGITGTPALASSTALARHWARLGSTMPLWAMVTGGRPKVQGEQEKQSEQSCREITAASKGNEMLGHQAILCLARCPSLPSRWAGVAQRCSFWSCGYGETCHTVNMELNLTPIYISRAWQWPSSLYRCSG